VDNFQLALHVKKMKYENVAQQEKIFNRNKNQMSLCMT